MVLAVILVILALGGIYGLVHCLQSRPKKSDKEEINEFLRRNLSKNLEQRVHPAPIEDSPEPPEPTFLDEIFKRRNSERTALRKLRR